MEKRYLILLSFFTFLSSFAQVNLQNGIYLCYPLDGNAADYSGNFHNGTVYGATAVADRFGNAGQAMSFNGSNNYISVNNTFPDMTHFSVSVWVYHTNPLHPSGILSDADATPYVDLFFNVSNDGVGIDANKPGGSVNKMDLYPLGSYGPAVTGQSLNNAWHHIVWVCDSSSQKIYIDTVLKFNMAISGTNKSYHNLAPSIGRLGDGVTNGGYFQYFSGSMDEFKMYSRALNFSEVKALFAGQGTCTGPVCIPPSISISGSNSICAGNSTVLTAGGTATSYTWSANAGGVHTNSVSVSPLSTTTYTLFGGDTSACSSMVTITVSVTATPTVNISGNTNICSGTSTSLYASGASSYTWNSGSGFTYGSSFYSYPSATTTYTVTGATNGCTSTKTVTVNVTQTPTVTVAGTTSVCSGNSVLLSGGTAASYTWSANAGSVHTSSVLVSPSGTTTYTLTGANGNCFANGYFTLSVTTTPTVSITADPTVLCSGASTALHASGAPSYTWSSNAGGSNQVNVTTVPQITTTYTLYGSNGQCLDSAAITITVNSTPTVVVSSDTICAGATGTLTASGASSYTWSPAPQFTNSNSSIILDAPGQTTTYTITGQALNGCKSIVTTTLFVDSCFTTGVLAKEQNNKFLVYPSPSESLVTVEVPNGSGELSVLSITGELVFKSQVLSRKSLIDLGDRPAGLYFIHVNTGDKLYSTKLLIKK